MTKGILVPPRTAFRRFFSAASITTLALIAGCSTPKKPAVAPPPVIETIRPVPPMGAVEGMSIPDVGPDGKRLTPNRGVTSNTALWHVRMALNVAALSCHGAGDLARLQYNQMLHVHKAVLGEANAAVDRNYKFEYGATGIGRREQLNTVVYNFFSLPPVQPTFCKAAVEVGAKMLSMPSASLLTYAPEGLAALEKPFQDFYEAYADYLRRLAEWQARFGASVTVVVSPTPLPPPPVPPGEIPAQGLAPRAPAAPQPAPAVATPPVAVVPTLPPARP
ncbi:hypothetical protein SAMN02927924_02058 [Sphingobium faniae]|nr:hypothetical protein SAMN02927924_02058 [Sphingobium faniae]